jgi:hypothetical protein
MPTGGFYIDAAPLKEFSARIKQSGNNVGKDMKPAMQRIERRNVPKVRARAPIGRTDMHKAGRGHLPPGSLRRGITGKATPSNVWIPANWDSGALILQEFGGKSVWHRGGAGALRGRGHKGYHTGTAGSERWIGGDSSAINRRHQGTLIARGWLVYKKPRRPRGYFIWNWPHYDRHGIGEDLAKGIADAAKRAGIEVEIVSGGGLQGDLQSPTFTR